MNIQDTLTRFYALQEKLSAYRHAVELIYYDGATTAPKATAENRAHALGILSEECYRLSTGDEMLSYLDILSEERDSLSTKDRRCLELALRDTKELKSIPLNEYVEYQRLIVEAEDVWHDAKENNDFAAFCPYLEKIFDAKRRFAKYCEPDTDPYDYCLGQFEDGLTTKRCDEFFAVLKSHLLPLISEISNAPQIDTSCLHGNFSDAAQTKLSYRLMDTMKIDRTHCGLGTTLHPFTTSIGSHHDVRITTNFKSDDFSSSMFSVIHEGGHALYDMNSDDSFAYTFLDGGVSMGIHESQSRFYENIIGRSRAFINMIFPTICDCLDIKDATADDLYRAVNAVSPSLIRTEADEVTYCLHVMIRYELERAVMNGTVAVRDLPREWNRLYREYLGVEVPDDTHGVLQDSHWSGGMIGYFPSYALGSAYGAHFLAKMRDELDVDTLISDGNFAPINEWNRKKIWRHGCMLKPDELLAETLGESFDPTYYTDYLEKKYKALYGIA